MILSHKKKYIFIHNPKVAGQSISSALYKGTYPLLPLPHYLRKVKSFISYKTPFFPNMFGDHITAMELKAALPEDIFNSYFKFGFVRNPWDWQASLYSYALKNTRHYRHKLIKSMKNFDEYLDWRVNNEMFLQKRCFFDRDDKLIVDFVGKLENLNDDFEYICKMTSVRTTLPHLTKAGGVIILKCIILENLLILFMMMY